MAPSKSDAENAVAAIQDDISMTDAQEAGDVLPEGDGRDEENKTRIRILPGANDTAASFQFEHEDHTLGNALRYIIMKNPDVEFCGYSIPHPSEPYMNVRIQTYNKSATEALEKGLNDLIDLCDVVVDKFVDAHSDFKSQMET